MVAMAKILKINQAYGDFFVANISNALLIGTVIILIIVLILLIQANKKEQQKEKEKNVVLSKKLDLALDKAETADRAKSTFLSNMSHDIRTPMNALIGYSNLALYNIDNKEKITDYLHKINQSAEHLLALINDILDMSRIESGDIVLKEGSEDLIDILNELQGIVDPDINNKQLDFSISVDVKNQNIVCDRTRLKQVLLNILSNSIKYTKEGGSISLTLKQIETVKDFGYYEFYIKDNGIGMSEEFLKTIYEPFTKEQTSTISGVHGTGLGMTIVQNIVDIMQGTIDTKSKKGVGTETILNFKFRLVNGIENTTSADTLEIKNFNFVGKKILLVEDNEMNREIAQEILEGEGFIIDTAEDGDIAVEKMKAAKPGQYDIILMDVQMPRMNGYEATKAIRALPNADVANIPVLAVTANVFEKDKNEAFDAGMNDHLSKPIEINKLKTMLAKYLN